MRAEDMAELIKAARHALEELANARDHLWLSPENAQPLTDEEMLTKIQAAFCALHYVMKKVEKQESRQQKRQVAKNATTEWVGLTEEELGKTVLANLDQTLWTLAKDIEAKLKEKNG